MRRRIAVYFSWDRLSEEAAILEVLDNRFLALFEARRIRWPELESLNDSQRFDQGIKGFLDHVFLKNFELFPQLVELWTSHAVPVVHRNSAVGRAFIDRQLLANLDTLVIISFDSQRTRQTAAQEEIEAIRDFLSDPLHAVFVSPHHDIGYVEELIGADQIKCQAAEHAHHGDPAIPPEQRFGGFALSLMAGLGMPIANRFGLRPATGSNGEPAAVDVTSPDRFKLLTGLIGLNEHPHLPHLERLACSSEKLEVLVRQPIDLNVPPHPFTRGGRTHFDAVLQAVPDAVRGCLVVADATLWNSSSGPRHTLEQFWRNVALASW